MIWTPIPRIEDARLIDVRLQLHHAAQVASSAARRYAEPNEDDSHTAFEWQNGRLVSGTIDADRPFRTALDITSAKLAIMEADGSTSADLTLDGITRSEAFRWLEARTNERGRAGVALEPDPRYELPEHAVSRGEPFDFSDRQATAALGQLFQNVSQWIAHWASEFEHTSPVRVWPHHFDMASLITVDDGALESVGLGMSPGDDGASTPYLYVTPWPYPEPHARPTADLGDGYWHGDGWFGAVLPFAALTGDVTSTVAQYSRSALEALVD